MNERDQKATLRFFETEMGIGAVAAARKLDTSYNTYKAWKSGRHQMPGCAFKAIELWLAIQE